jgi:hypothetical protein
MAIPAHAPGAREPARVAEKRQKAKIVGCFARLWLLSRDRSVPAIVFPVFFGSQPIDSKGIIRKTGGPEGSLAVTPAVAAKPGTGLLGLESSSVPNNVNT